MLRNAQGPGCRGGVALMSGLLGGLLGSIVGLGGTAATAKHPAAASAYTWALGGAALFGPIGFGIVGENVTPSMSGCPRNRREAGTRDSCNAPLLGWAAGAVAGGLGFGVLGYALANSSNSSRSGEESPSLRLVVGPDGSATALVEMEW